jgi:histidine kinase
MEARKNLNREQPIRRLPLRRALAFRLGLGMGLLTLFSVLAFGYFSVTSQRAELIGQVEEKAHWLGEGIVTGLKQGMARHDPEGIDGLVQAVGRQRGVSLVRLMDRTGTVRFTTNPEELGRKLDATEESCNSCHSQGIPARAGKAAKMARLYSTDTGGRLLGTITHIYNERSCFSAPCHFHKEGQRVLGILEVGVSLEEAYRSISAAVTKTSLFAISLFLGITALFVAGLLFFIERPIRRILDATHRISRGDYGCKLDETSQDELGELARSFNRLSERIRTREEELEKSRQEHETLFENVPAYVAVVDREYRIVQANKNFKETFGHRVGESCFSAYKGLDEKCPNCPVEMTFSDGACHRSEEIGLNKRGKEIHYLVYTAPIFDREGEALYAIEMSVDLTVTKRLEKELRVSQEYLDNLVENSIHGIVATDATGKIIIFNRAAERILGYDASQVKETRDLERFFPLEFVQMIWSGLRQGTARRDLKMVAQETWLRSSKGERVPVRFSGVLLWEDGTPVGAVGFFQDLTAFKALEQEKLQAERLAVVGQTVAALAHGIKNIITGLEGGVYVVQTAMKRRDDSLLQKGWGMVERNIEKISHTVKDLLTYSKVAAVDMQPVKPTEIVEEVLSLFKDKARQCGVEIVLEAPADLPMAYLDPKAIHTCLTNLVSNAIDACVEDTSKSDHRVIVRTRLEEDDSLVFEVIDNGVGMSEEVRAKAFSSFFTTKGTKGTGLGLMVTDKLVQEHGGKITVESAPGLGSTFRITIPRAPEEASGGLHEGPGA